MSSTLAGKVALVTGASSGIGRSAAIRLGADGAFVGVHYRTNARGAQDTLAAVQSADGTGFTLQADFAQPGATEIL